MPAGEEVSTRAVAKRDLRRPPLGDDRRRLAVHRLIARLTEAGDQFRVVPPKALNSQPLIDDPWPGWPRPAPAVAPIALGLRLRTAQRIDSGAKCADADAAPLTPARART